MNEERCVLCNKPYEYEHYHLFGRGCLRNLYDLLVVPNPPRGTKDKEMYLCTTIAWRNHKFFLNRNKKYALIQKYVALKYLDRINFNSYPYVNKFEEKDIDNNVLIDNIKDKISNDIKSISLFSKNIKESIKFKLNDVYELYNDVQRFGDLIRDIQSINIEKLDEELAENVFNSLKYIFDKAQKDSPVIYETYYTMQYLFWKIVVAGGLLVNMRLSAQLLNHSLALIAQNKVEDMVITEESLVNIIREDKEFKKIIDSLISKKADDNGTIDVKNENVKFDDMDLHFSLHNTIMNVNGNSIGDIWNINVELNDTYDFTEFKNIKKYFNVSSSVPKSILSTTLNNFGVVSYEYGVIRKYGVKVQFNMKYNYATKVVIH